MMLPVLHILLLASLPWTHEKPHSSHKHKDLTRTCLSSAALIIRGKIHIWGKGFCSVSRLKLLLG